MSAPCHRRVIEDVVREWADIVDDIQTNWWIYAAMPVLAGLIGYCTKLVAIKMMFRPHEFKGIGPLGWQGIIPRRAPEMVAVLCETLTGRLISAGDIVIVAVLYAGVVDAVTSYGDALAGKIEIGHEPAEPRPLIVERIRA